MSLLEKLSVSPLRARKNSLSAWNSLTFYEGKNLEAGKKSYAVSFVLQDESKTMNDKQTEAIMAKILKQLEQQLGAVLRG